MTTATPYLPRSPHPHRRSPRAASIELIEVRVRPHRIARKTTRTWSAESACAASFPPRGANVASYRGAASAEHVCPVRDCFTAQTTGRSGRSGGSSAACRPPLAVVCFARGGLSANEGAQLASDSLLAEACPACGSSDMRLISSPRPQFVEQCCTCNSTFFHFGAAETLSHNEQYNVDVNYQRYLELANETSEARRYEETIDHLSAMLSRVEHPSVFDIGAGGGNFLARARARGFQIAGNEVSQPAVDECRARHGVELTLGDDLQEIANTTGTYDAVTMWCVIAHVDDPEELLRGARALLRPGGVMFLSTPRYCSIDRAALALRRTTADRYRRIFDRRINHFHRRQYSRRGMQALLSREGFKPISVQPAIGYGLQMEAYLTSIAFPDAISRPIGEVLGLAAKAKLLPRNILNVYAEAV